MQQPNGQQPPQKLIDFNEELKALCTKYLYELRVVHVFDSFQGHTAVIQAFDVSPQDLGVPLNPTAPAAAPEQPVAPVDPVVPPVADPAGAVVPEAAPVDPAKKNDSPETVNPSQSPEENASVDTELKN